MGSSIPNFTPQRRPNFGRNIAVVGQFAEWISGREREQDKKNETDAEQTGKRDDQAPENVFSHRPSRCRPFSPYASQSPARSQGSRYQLASCHKSLSQPLRCAVTPPFRAVTRARDSSGRM